MSEPGPHTANQIFPARFERSLNLRLAACGAAK